MKRKFAFLHRARAGAIHLLLSGLVAALAAALVFGLWYPGFFRDVSGGRELFLLVTVVDLVVGPLLTFTVFDPRKPARELGRDLATIGVLQLAALVYGVHTVYLARPIAVVFEIDRLRVLTTDQIRTSELPQARAEYRKLPVAGPWFLSVRPPTDDAARNEALFAAVDGYDLAQRPIFWMPYSQRTTELLGRARPISILLRRYPARMAEFKRRLDELQLDAGDVKFIPMVARGDWIAVIRADGQIGGVIAADGFF